MAKKEIDVLKLAKTIIKLHEDNPDEFDTLIENLSNIEDVSESLLQGFSNKALINTMIGRGELYEAVEYYFGDPSCIQEAHEYWTRLSQGDKVRCLSNWLGVPYLAEADEWAQGVKNFIDKR